MEIQVEGSIIRGKDAQRDAYIQVHKLDSLVNIHGDRSFDISFGGPYS